MWSVERANGGRGFGFTGGHFHDNWGNDNFRKIVLNALLWAAQVEVPVNGVDSTVSPDELEANLDPKKK
jgi:type 1 glutamine amidotransferase